MYSSRGSSWWGAGWLGQSPRGLPGLMTVPRVWAGVVAAQVPVCVTAHPSVYLRPGHFAIWKSSFVIKKFRDDTATCDGTCRKSGCPVCLPFRMDVLRLRPVCARTTVQNVQGARHGRSLGDGHPIELCGFLTDSVQTSPSQMTEQKVQPLLLVMQNRTWYLESNHAASTKAKHTPTHTLMTQ